MRTASHEAQPRPLPLVGDGEGDAAHPTLDTPAFPFDAGPYVRFPPPLGTGGTELRPVRRRAVAAVVVAWVPLAVLTAAEGLAIRPNPRESFLLDIAAYGRYLVALPLLILAEHVALPKLGRIVRHLATSALLPASERPLYEALVASTRGLLCSRVAALAIVALAYLSTMRLTELVYPANISTWAAPIADGARTLSLAGWWRVFVSQPLFALVLGMWVWRAAVWASFLYRATRLDLRLVASHPDHLGGLQFVASSVRAFPLVGFAMATGAAGNVAEKVVFDGSRVLDFKYLIALVVVLVIILFVGPLLTLHAPLKRLRTSGIFSYGELASDLGRRFEARWLPPGRDVEDDALEAPDFSAVTDAYSIVDNVGAIKLIPVNLKEAVPLVAATVSPFVPLLLLATPIEEIVKFAVNFLL